MVPTLTPLTFHWYAGVVPPLVGVAVKVTDDPLQTGFAEAAMRTLTGLGVVAVITALPFMAPVR